MSVPVCHLGTAPMFHWTKASEECYYSIALPLNMQISSWKCAINGMMSADEIDDSGLFGEEKHLGEMQSFPEKITMRGWLV